MRKTLSHILSEIEKQERKVSSSTTRMIDEAYQMTIYLQELLNTLKEYILKEGFKDSKEEINFFKNTKPQILGKLIYYNKVFRIETSCPVETGKVYHSYFSAQLQELKLDFRENISNSYFYRYYRLGREDRDEEYFMRGRINYHEGLNSFVFEIDPQFCTYYDYKAARIVANELLYTYLLTRISPDENPDNILLDGEATKDIFWTQTKNALIELIYALYAATAISHGKIGIRKISMIFQVLFRISLTDIHNSFHRMKTRAGSRTLFLDQLKASLEEYMDREDSY